MRTGEVFALTWDDIDLENRTIMITKTVYAKDKSKTGRWYLGTTKTEGSEREVYICDNLYSILVNYKEQQDKNKKELGKYKLCDITPYLLNQTLLGLYQKTQTKETLRNYQKVIKSSLRDATYYFGFIGNDPAGSLQIPRILSFDSKKTVESIFIP